MARFDLNLLNALHTLLKEKNVTRAAERLHVTQPTMSGMLQRLRYQFGDELLVRNGRAMELTPLAAALAQPVGEALRSVELLVRAEPRFDPTSSRRSFSIMASDYCTSLFLPHIIRHISLNAPDIQITIQSLNQPLERLMAGEIDLAVSTEDFSLQARADIDGKLLADRLSSDDMVCLVDINHPLRDGAALDDILSYPGVGVVMPGTVGSSMMSLGRIAPSFVPQYVVSEFGLVAPLVVNTRLIGLVQRRFAQVMALKYPVRHLRPPFIMAELNEAAVWHPRHSRDPAHLWLRHVIKQVVADNIGSNEAQKLSQRGHDHPARLKVVS